VGGVLFVMCEVNFEKSNACKRSVGLCIIVSLTYIYVIPNTLCLKKGPSYAEMYDMAKRHLRISFPFYVKCDSMTLRKCGWEVNGRK
jgi:hypothetical protein